MNCIAGRKGDDMEKTQNTKNGKNAVKKKTGEHNNVTLLNNHPHHEKHLCSMVGKRNMKTVAKLAKEAKYLCLICGRAAKSEHNLCWPTEF